MKTTLLVLLIAVALFIGYGCSGPPRRDDVPGNRDFKADFLRQRDDAEVNVRLTKAKFKPGSPEFIEAQNRYQRAKSSVNLLLEGIQNSIRSGSNPAAASYYGSRAQEASDTLDGFNKYVVNNALPPEERPKFIPLLLPLVTPLVGLFLDRMNAAGSRDTQERKATYEQIAADLNSVRFAEFNDVRP